MSVWRFPFIHFAWLTATVGLTCLLVACVAARMRVTSHALRGLLVAVGMLAVVCTPLYVYRVAEKELTFLMKHGVYGHYRAWAFLAPVLAASFLTAGTFLLFPDRGTRSTVSSRALFLATCFAFAALNLLNWCSPGWCEKFGFPFPYSWWSDSMIWINGENLTGGMSILAGTANFAILATIVALMVRNNRHAAAAQLDK